MRLGTNLIFLILTLMLSGFTCSTKSGPPAAVDDPLKNSHSGEFDETEIMELDESFKIDDGNSETFGIEGELFQESDDLDPYLDAEELYDNMPQDEATPFTDDY